MVTMFFFLHGKMFSTKSTTVNAKGEFIFVPQNSAENIYFAITENSVVIMFFSSLFISLAQWTVFSTFKAVCSNKKNASRAR